MKNIINRSDIIREDEATRAPLNDQEVRARRERIDAVKAYVLDFTTNKFACISMDDVYCDEDLNCLDGDMYDAFDELLAEGILRGPSLAQVKDHVQAKYSRLPRVGDYCTYQVGSDAYAYRITSVASHERMFTFDRILFGIYDTTACLATDGHYYTKGGKHLVYPGLNKPNRDPSF